jgi:predicted trehalose synthase
VEARLRRWGEVWRRAAEGAFLEGYRGEAARSAARLLPTTPSGTAEALAAFELDKACYELAYELDNRPSWVSIPLRGLARLLTRSREEAPGV